MNPWPEVGGCLLMCVAPVALMFAYGALRAFVIDPAIRRHNERPH